MAARPSTTKTQPAADPTAVLAALAAAGITPDQLMAALGGQPAGVPSQPAARQAKPKPSDPALADVQAAIANAVGCVKSRGALVNGVAVGDAYTSGSRGYRGTCKLEVPGADGNMVSMSMTYQAVIWHTKPESADDQD